MYIGTNMDTNILTGIDIYIDLDTGTDIYIYVYPLIGLIYTYACRGVPPT